MIPQPYGALLALALLGGAFGVGYWRGDRSAQRDLGACRADKDAAVAAVAEQGARLDNLNLKLKTIADGMEAAKQKAGEAADAARAAGRGNQARARSLSGIDCQTTNDAARALAPELMRQYRPPA